jgi:lipopolysaccharide export LptBFGC system permease protein LptF
MAAQSPGKIKPGRASLIGGIAVGIAVFVLWVALARDLGVAGAWPVAAGLVLASGIAAWIRIADL